MVERVAQVLAAGLVVAALWVVWNWPPGSVPVGPAPGLPLPSEGQGPRLELASRSAVLMDDQSGRVLYAHNPHEPLPPASVTKLMTLLLALEAVQQGKVSMADEVVASEHAASMGGSQIWLEVGERMSLRDLLNAVAVGSANDAAVAVAEHLAGSEPAFVDRMNRRARELGMRNTRFANATGLPPEETGDPGPHEASAYDLALLSRAAIRTPHFLSMVSTWEYTMRAGGIQKPVLYNLNRLLKRYPGVDGLKTGMTARAGYCIAVTARRDNLRLIVVTMGAPTAQAREKDVRTLLDWGFRRYEARRLAQAGETVATLEVARGRPRYVPVVLGDDAFLTVERGSRVELDSRVELSRTLVAPVPAGTVVGRMLIFDRPAGTLLAEVPVRVSEAVPVAPGGELIGRQLGEFFRVLVPPGRKPPAG